jgi:putative PIN family toxin of toxin-antitoxin system
VTVPRAVLDTHVLLDCWLFEDARVAALRTAVEAGRLIALASGALVDEYADVLGRVHLDVSAERRATLLRHWHRLAVAVSPVLPAPFSCRDPKDQMLLDLAVTARADWLVTRDKALLAVRARAERAGFAVLTPEVAAARLVVPLPAASDRA